MHIANKQANKLTLKAELFILKLTKIKLINTFHFRNFIEKILVIKMSTSSSKNADSILDQYFDFPYVKKSAYQIRKNENNEDEYERDDNPMEQIISKAVNIREGKAVSKFPTPPGSTKITPRKYGFDTHSTLTESVDINTTKSRTIFASPSVLSENVTLFYDRLNDRNSKPTGQVMYSSQFNEPITPKANSSSYLSENPLNFNNTCSTNQAENLGKYTKKAKSEFSPHDVNNETYLRNLFDLVSSQTSQTNHHRSDIQFESKRLIDPANQDDFEEEEDREEEFKRYTVCMIYQNKKFACVYYDSAAKSLHYLMDTAEDSRFELANLIISDIEPDLILTCTKSDEQFLKYLKIKCMFNNPDDNNAYFSSKAKSQVKPIQLVQMANTDFNFEHCRERICQIQTLEHQSPHMEESQRVLYFTSMLNFNDRQMIRCMGALLTYLDRNLDNYYIETKSGSSVELPILFIKEIKLGNLLIMDHNTYKSLQIFNDVDLFSANKQVAPEFAANFRTTLNFKMNANTTLYSMFLSKIHTKVGIGKLRSFMLRPTRDAETLSQRHTVIEFLTDLRSRRLVEKLRKSLRKCKFVNALLRKMRIASCSWSEWKRLYHTTVSLCEMAQLARIANDELTRVQQKKQATASNTTASSSVNNYSKPNFFSSESFTDGLSPINPFAFVSSILSFKKTFT